MNSSSSSAKSLIDPLILAKLPYVDIALAKLLQEQFAPSNPEVIPLILHLSLASRMGHLCIKVNNQEIQPPLRDLWEFEDDSVLSIVDWDELQNMIKSSIQDIPLKLVSKIESIDQAPSPTPIYQYQDLFYFQKHWDSESICIQKFQQLINTPPQLPLDEQCIEHQLLQLLHDQQLLPEQAQAIKQLSDHSLTLIAGGPGTGKTYTAGLLIKTFWEALPLIHKKKCRIALAAPTGKAAANLQNSLNKAAQYLEGLPPLQATTLHSLLGLKSNHVSSDIRAIQADLLVIDECSMIDIRLMSHLLRSLKPGARLILIGDPFQLPPVSTGSFFSDMLSLCPPHQFIVLKNCLRTELQSIVDLSQAIKDGSCSKAFQAINQSNQALIFKQISKDSSPLEIQLSLWEEVWRHIKNTSDSHSSESFRSFRLLTPLRQGPFGVNQLNAFFFKELLKKWGEKQTLTLPIMITSNQPKQQLFNGDIGFLVLHPPIDPAGRIHLGDYATFGERKIPAMLLPSYEYAFCLSIHKSQGSEFDEVLVLMPEGSEHFGRELVYTAVTRARKRLEIWSSHEIFDKTLEKINRRLSRVNH